MKITILKKIAALKEFLSSKQKIALAYSGGVDSSFLAFIAQQALQENFLAITVKHPCLPEKHLLEATDFAKKHQIRHKIVSFSQLDLPEFVENSPLRCYHCKKALMQLLLNTTKKEGFELLMDGSNADDLNEYRPGSKAISELNIISPLQELSWSKNEIRLAARLFELPIADMLSYSCLATRIPYNQSVTSEKLQQIEAMEELMQSKGFKDCRVRHHGELFRIELRKEDFYKILAEKLRKEIYEKAQKLGVEYCSIDCK